MARVVSPNRANLWNQCSVRIWLASDGIEAAASSASWATPPAGRRDMSTVIPAGGGNHLRHPLSVGGKRGAGRDKPAIYQAMGTDDALNRASMAAVSS